MAKRILITKAFDDGNKKLFTSSKPTYRNLHSLSKEIGERLGIPHKRVFYRIKVWEKGVGNFRINSEDVMNLFFELLCLEKENYIIETKKEEDYE